MNDYTIRPPLVHSGSDLHDPDLEALIQAAYDNGYYAGQGNSGSDLHQTRLSERNHMWHKMFMRLAAAERLAEALKDIAESGEGRWKATTGAGHQLCIEIALKALAAWRGEEA